MINKTKNSQPLHYDNFENLNWNKLIAYLSIINSLNYKWYKSAKRRVLLPNFYFTRCFYNFTRIILFKHSFRKHSQTCKNLSKLNPVGFFEKKMFLKQFFAFEQLDKIGLYFFLSRKRNVDFLKKSRFFFENLRFNFLEKSTLLVSGDLEEIPINFSNFSFFLKKNTSDFDTIGNVNINFLTYFTLANCCLLEFYKINNLFYLHIILRNNLINF